jgi:hypothetical protein
MAYQSVPYSSLHQRPSTLHHKVLTMEAYWGADTEDDQKPTLNPAPLPESGHFQASCRIFTLSIFLLIDQTA